MINVFVGYDSKEKVAYNVLSHSIIQNSTKPVAITPIALNNLKDDFVRERNNISSTEFSFSRFMIPHLMNYQGWALFMDCDMLMFEDIAELWRLRDDRFAVQVCKHDYTPKEGIKMDGQKQTIYPRKNWSSVVLWNCGHPSNKVVDQDQVNSLELNGAYFHRFQWLEDSEIGKLDHTWNYLVGVYDDIEKLKKMNLAKGGSLENAIVVNDKKVLNKLNKKGISASYIVSKTKADAIKDVVTKSKNPVDSQARKSQGEVFINGMKVKAISGADSTKLKIKTRKFN